MFEILASLLVWTLALGPVQAADDDIGWRFGFDAKGRTVSMTDPGRAITRLRYSDDENGQLRFMTAEYPSGQKVTQSFNPLGQRTRMTDAAGTVDYSYDKAGRLISVRREGMPAVVYGHDRSGRIQAITIGRQPLVSYEYDIRGRVEKATTPAGDVRYRYGGDSSVVTRELPNGIATRWTYRPDGRILSIAHTGPNNRLLARYDYAYRADGLIEQVEESTGSVTLRRSYEYDTVGRLVSFRTSTGTTIDYSYDRFGNRISQRTRGGAEDQSQYDWAGRLLTHDGRQCRHDAAGNLITCDGSEATFSFGDMFRLESASLPGQTVRYRYDGDGNMIGRVNADLRQAFVPDPLADAWRPLMVQASNGTQTLYLWEGAAPLIAIGGEVVQFMLHDHLGSVRVIANQRGDVIERRDYSPFGEAMGRPIVGGLQPAFAGLFFDTPASIYLSQARAYQPTMGRFIQPDSEDRLSFGSQKDTSRYTYSGGDPINFVDLDGARPAWTTMGYWSTGAQLLFDTTAVKQFMFDQSNRSIDQAAQTGIFVATTKATIFDVAGGLFPGKHPNQGQQLASVGWGLAAVLGGRLDIGYRSIVLPGTFRAATLGSIGKIQAGTALSVKISQGDMKGAVSDIAMFGWKQAADKTSRKAFSLLTDGLDKMAAGRQLKLVSDAMKVGELSYSYQQKISKTLTDSMDLVFPKSTPESQRSSSVSGGSPPRSFVSGIGPFTPQLPRGTASNQANSQASPDSYRTPWMATHFQASSIPLSKQESAAWYQSRSSSSSFQSSSFSTSGASKVGGIRLSGAGASLGGVGRINGVVYNKRGDQVIFLGNDQEQVQVPALRLDDVVTIFRSVYQQGEAPSVSIDPISDRKTESLMKVRHGRGTENTYVGWVLFEADRLMKSYQFGKDNRTKGLLVSHVPGYRALYGRGTATSNPVWERFWIVPDSVSGERDASSTLTTLQVPLRVETERMEWRDGKFQTARDPTPSPSAKQFTEWFTKNYDRIAEEALLKPPPECGVGEQRVPVFHELRRMALITAIAETLRDQNVPFPAWMRDYPVKPCPVDLTTPVLRDVERGEYMLTGGVQLAVPEARRHIVSGGAAPGRLARAVEQRAAVMPMLSAEAFEVDGVKRQAVTLPGSGSLRGGANLLQHTDLVLPLGRQGGSLALTRQSNSFFDPAGPFGRGWTLDLPQLERQPVLVNGDGRDVPIRAFELISPLNSGSARFAARRVVPEFNREMWVPATPGEMLGCVFQ